MSYQEPRKRRPSPSKPREKRANPGVEIEFYRHDGRLTALLTLDGQLSGTSRHLKLLYTNKYFLLGQS